MSNRPGVGVSAHAFAAINAGVFRAAARLVDVDSNEPGLLSLTSTRILDNAIRLLCENSPALQNILAVSFGVGGVIIGIYTRVWQNKIFQHVFVGLTGTFKGSVTITASNPLNKTVMLHLVKKGLGKDARTLTVVNPDDGKQRESQHAMFFGDYEGRSRAPKKHEEAASEPDPLDYIPSVGVQPIKDFLHDVTVEANCEKKGNKTTVFKMKIDSSAIGWDSGVSWPARTLDSVAIEKQKKDKLVKEITRYLSPAEEKYYAARGIPYRRGLLFYGPPGTGKTSFSVALAGHFKLNLYIVSMSNREMNDADLETLFELLPYRCVVLMEDIDSSGIQREAPAAEPEQANTQQPADGKKQQRGYRKPPTGVTLAGLLNVLDGPASKDGRLVCMTSNDPDVLDAALIRSGRIDSKILFDYASHEVSSLLFTHIFTRTAEEIAADIHPQAAHDIPTLAAQFAAQIPEGKITPAEVQNFLLRNRDDPLAAVADATAFAKDVIEAKERKANVAVFANEIAKPAAPAAEEVKVEVVKQAATPQSSRRKCVVSHGDEAEDFDDDDSEFEDEEGEPLEFSAALAGAFNAAAFGGAVRRM